MLMFNLRCSVPSVTVVEMESTLMDVVLRVDENDYAAALDLVMERITPQCRDSRALGLAIRVAFILLCHAPERSA